MSTKLPLNKNWSGVKCGGIHLQFGNQEEATGGSACQDHPQLYTEFDISLGYKDPVSKNKTNQNKLING